MTFDVRGERAFTLAELLVVIGVIALLISIIIPPVSLAHRQAKQTQCAANLNRIGLALQAAANDNSEFYPLWDDGGTPMRYTWIDVLLQTQALSSPKIGYCPEDNRPDSLNMARGAYYGVYYPEGSVTYGIDYSYGIGVPLSAGGWVPWNVTGAADPHSRVFVGHETNTSARVLAADAVWSNIYNLGAEGAIWNSPTQFDNRITWGRHPGHSANLLKQDGHVANVAYQNKQERPVETQKHFVWHAGESLTVGPMDRYADNYYPNRPPVDMSDSSRGSFPIELNPHYYTERQIWTNIKHK